MSSTGYLLWFIATAIMTVVVMGGGIALATGAFDKGERERRKVRREAERVAHARVDVPAQRSVSPPAAPGPGGPSVPAADHTAPSRQR